MIEITPTTPLPEYPLTLDGDTDLWDNPQLVYLDGNTSMRTAVDPLIGQRIIHHRPIELPPEPRRYAYHFPHPEPELCIGPGKVYFDGNRYTISNTMYHIEEAQQADGNAPAIPVIGLNIPGFEFDEMTYCPERKILGPAVKLDFGWTVVDLQPGETLEFGGDVEFWSGSTADGWFFSDYIDAQGTTYLDQYYFSKNNHIYEAIFKANEPGESKFEILYDIPSLTVDTFREESHWIGPPPSSWGRHVYITNTNGSSAYYSFGVMDPDLWSKGTFEGGSKILIQANNVNCTYRVVTKGSAAWYHYGPTTWQVSNVFGNLNLLDNLMLNLQLYDKSIEFDSEHIKLGAIFPEQIVTPESYEWSKIRFVPVVTLKGLNLERVENADGELLAYTYMRSKVVTDITLLASPNHDGNGIVYPDKTPVTAYKQLIYDKKNLGSLYLFDNTGFHDSVDGKTVSYTGKAYEYRGVILVQGVLNWVKLRYNSPGLYDVVSSQIVLGQIPRNRKLFPTKVFNKKLKV
jgi:hypothetical protein